jgi:hypothetical protein
MAYFKANVKSSTDKLSKLSDKCLHIQNLLYVLFKHILISMSNFVGTPNSMRKLFPPY